MPYRYKPQTPNAPPPLRVPQNRASVSPPPPATTEEEPSVPQNTIIVREGISPKSGGTGSKVPFAVMSLFLLFIVSNITSGNFQTVISYIQDPKNAHTKNANIGLAGVHELVIIMGGELVFLVLLDMFAQTSEGAANASIAFAIALWFVWGVKNINTMQSWIGKVTGKNG